MKTPSNKYLLSYSYENHGITGFGSLSIIQNTYAPITEEVLQDAIRIVREKSGFDETAKIAPIAFTRFEA